MPPRRTISPLSLEDLCLSEVLNYFKRELTFCNHVRQFQHDSLLLRRRGIDADGLMAELRGHLDVLPPLLSEMVRQRLTNRILKKTKAMANEPGLLVGILDVVLNEEVKSLELCDSCLGNDCDIWPLIEKKCTGLERFAIASDMFKSKETTHQFFLRTLISNCTMLTELVLKDAVRDSLTTAAIGKSCSRLRVLDLTGSTVSCEDMLHLCLRSPSSVSEESICEADLNPLCQTLEVLHLGNTDVRARGAAIVLRFIPNLTSLGSCVYTASGLRRLYALKNKPYQCHKFKHAFYRRSSNGKLKALANSCPSLESLHIGCDAPRRLRFQISSAGIDLGIVGQCCPLLEKLTVSKNPSRTVSLPPNKAPIYTKLQELKVTCAVSVECAALFMTNATKLRNLEINRIRDLSDDIFAAWLRKNPLKYLEELMLRYVLLTKESVHLLFACCPRLSRLGDLGSWDIRSWEFKRFRNLVKRENYAIHLTFDTDCDINISEFLLGLYEDD
ncbi:hypothetical protein C0J52_05185 [Blattella germanica]|nr:hypothetical protein C0J52_05185 [Blattella germanica]